MKYALLLVSILCAITAHAQWHNVHGIYGGNVTSAVQATNADGKPVLIATENGVWRSTDHFKTWSASGLQENVVERLCTATDGAREVTFASVTTYLDIANPETHSLGLYPEVHHSLWRSTNGGLSWDSLRMFRGPIVGLFQLSKSIYVVISRVVDSNELYSSSDLGSNAFEYLGGIGSGIVEAEGIGDYIVAAGGERTIRRKITDDKVEVVQDSLGVEGIEKYDSLLVLESYRGFRYSADSGRTWQSRGTQSTYSDRIATHGDTILSRASRSTDRGYTWSPIAAPGVMLRYRDSAWMASSAVGPYVSPTGTEWAQSIEGIEAIRVYDVAVQNDTAFAITAQGILATPDGGKTWFGTKLPYPVDKAQCKFLRSGGNLFCCADKHTWIWNGEWTHFIDSTVLGIAVKGRTVFASVSFTDGSDGILLRSWDGGGSWKNVSPPPLVEMSTVGEVLIIDTQTFVRMGGWSGEEALYVSGDLGKHWNRETHDYWGYAWNFVVLGRDVYAGTDIGLWKSTDVGATWLQLPEVGGLRELRAGSTDLIARTLDTGAVGHLILISADGSIHVELSGDSTSDFTSMDADRQFMIAGTVSRGVWITPLMTGGVRPEQGIAENVTAYPDPASAFVVISIPERVEPLSVKMFSVNGQEVKPHYSFTSNSLRVETKELAAGAYTVRITTGDKSFAARVVIER
jgi:hypothetical protein